jgi:pectinesterase
MKQITVRPDDDLQSILDKAESGTTIHFAPGVYRQKLMLTTPGLILEGEGADQCALVWDDYAKELDEQGREYVTFRTWTLAVCADNVQMRALSVINNALNPQDKGQEVALTVYGDNFQMRDCVLRSTQDTLFLGPLPPDLIERYDGFLPDALRDSRELRSHFSRCIIAGSVDFIFGCGAALFEDCEILNVPDGRDHGFVAAPAHTKEQKEGFVFRRCRFTREEGVADGSIFLARPWRDYGLSSFIDCAYGPHIRPEGFDPWLDSGRDKTARFFESPAVAGRVDWCNRQS